MHFKELMRSRYSVREYHENKVDRTLLNEVLNAARVAPSAANKQPWHFVVVDDDEVLDNLRPAYDREWFKGVPCLIVAFANHEESWKRSYDLKDHSDIDVAIAIDHLTLMATQLGLGTCWVCHFKDTIVKEVLNAPEYLEPVAVITIGYPKDLNIPEKNRKELKEIVSYNTL